MSHRPNRPRAIAVAAPAPYAGPGHLVILAALAVLALLLVSSITKAHAGIFGGPAEVKAKAGAVAIPVADVSDGKAHFYSIKAGGKDVKFFVVKSKDGVIRTALDACDVCYRAKKGYKQEGDVMVCNNCGMKFATARVMDVKGGCNPSPLPRTVDAKNVVIKESDLAAGAKFF